MKLDYYEYQFVALPFGEALKRMRFSTEMTMDSLATISGVSQSYISQIENGVRLPSDKVIKKIALAFAKKVIEQEIYSSPFHELSEDSFVYSEEEKSNKISIKIEEEALEVEKILQKVKMNDKSNIKEIQNSDLTKEELKILTIYRNLSNEKKKSFLSMLDLLKN